MARKKISKKEQERREALRERDAAREARRDFNTDYNNPDQLLSLRQFDRLNGLSPTQRKRIFRAGKGPPVVQLSEHRVGIRVGDNRKWQGDRIRT